MIGGLGPEGSIEYSNMMAYLHGQKGIEGPRDKQNRSNILSNRFSRALVWIKSWLPPEPREIVAPLDLYDHLNTEIARANRAQLSHAFGEQQLHDSQARQHLMDSGLDAVFTLTPGITGLQLNERSKFKGRITPHILEEREQVVVQIDPRTL